jgi:hypothetical protein
VPFEEETIHVKKTIASLIEFLLPPIFLARSGSE